MKCAPFGFWRQSLHGRRSQHRTNFWVLALQSFPRDHDPLNSVNGATVNRDPYGDRDENYSARLRQGPQRIDRHLHHFLSMLRLFLNAPEILLWLRVSGTVG